MTEATIQIFRGDPAHWEKYKNEGSVDSAERIAAELARRMRKPTRVKNSEGHQSARFAAGTGHRVR